MSGVPHRAQKLLAVPVVSSRKRVIFARPLGHPKAAAPAADVSRIGSAVGAPGRTGMIVPGPSGGNVDLDLHRAAETLTRHRWCRMCFVPCLQSSLWPRGTSWRVVGGACRLQQIGHRRPIARDRVEVLGIALAGDALVMGAHVGGVRIDVRDAGLLPEAELAPPVVRCADAGRHPDFQSHRRRDRVPPRGSPYAAFRKPSAPRRRRDRQAA